MNQPKETDKKREWKSFSPYSVRSGGGEETEYPPDTHTRLDQFSRIPCQPNQTHTEAAGQVLGLTSGGSYWGAHHVKCTLGPGICAC